MKKIQNPLMHALIIALAFSLSGCSSAADSTKATENSASASTAPEHTSEQILIAYFSCTGNTAGIAKSIAEITGGTLYQIMPMQPYTSEDLDYNNTDSRTSVEQNNQDARPEISGTVPNWEQYSIVYVGYPIWWGKEPAVMDTFVEKYDFSDKTVIPFCTSAESGIGSSGTTLASLAKGTGTWLEGRRLQKETSSSEISQWITSLNLN